jgi:DNA-binding response OmpR family regulator
VKKNPPKEPQPETKATGTILVVDDDPQAVDIISRLLRAKGFSTVPARSGRECLEAVRKHAVDVILLDVMMPGMDGLAVSRELGKDEKTRAIPIILLTGKDDHETRAAGMTLGVSEFLTKPINKSELYLRVEAQLHIRAQAREMDETLEKVK